MKRWGILTTAFAFTFAPSVFASAFSEYGTNGKEITLDLPTVSAGWFVAVDGFPAGSPSVGSYALSGRLLAANGSKVYLQKNYGSDVWVEVANIGAGAMDPSFLKISPDGSKVALGVGYGAPLIVFPSSLLSLTSPPNLVTNAGAKKISADYYDGDFYTNDLMVVNGGWGSGSSWGSGVYALDVTAATPTPIPLIGSIPGASAGVAADVYGNVVTGIGYLTSPNRTGEIKIWSAADIADVIAGITPQLSYGTTGELLAENILSAAALGFDAYGNLHVGGGDAFGVGGPTENGYAALIEASIVASVVAGLGFPVDEGSSSEYAELTPDICEDDSATSPIAYVGGVDALAISWNPSGDEYGSPVGACYSPGSANDYWEVGVTPRVTLYFPNSAPDADSDGIPNGADNAYLTANAAQWDTDGDGWGNAADADFNNDGTVGSADLAIWSAANGKSVGQPGYNANADMDSDGDVDTADRIKLLARWGATPPYY